MDVLMVNFPHKIFNSSGQIIITRSLGDHLMKEFIIGSPYLKSEKLSESDTWLIVACDGVIFCFFIFC